MVPQWQILVVEGEIGAFPKIIAKVTFHLVTLNFFLQHLQTDLYFKESANSAFAQALESKSTRCVVDQGKLPLHLISLGPLKGNY